MYPKVFYKHILVIFLLVRAQFSMNFSEESYCSGKTTYFISKTRIFNQVNFNPPANLIYHSKFFTATYFVVTRHISTKIKRNFPFIIRSKRK